VTTCPIGQAPSPTGVCTPASLNGFVYVGVEGSLNNALNTQLDRNAVTPTVHINTSTYLIGNADIGGTKIEGDTGGSIVMVNAPSTLISSNYGIGNKPTVMTLVTFDISLSVIASPLVNVTAANAPLSSFTASGVSFNYRTTLGVPLVVLSGVDNVQFTNSTFSRNGTKSVQSDFSDLCQVQTNSPALDLYNVKGTISACTFQNLNTGVYVYVFSEIKCYLNKYCICI
jgi:hypothetical protein